MSTPSLQATHGAHSPPQSTSVSAPLRTASTHEGGSHRSSRQIRLSQSEACWQIAPAPQPAQSPPPQSMSVSSRFVKPSSQVGHWQEGPSSGGRRLSSKQNPVSQSECCRHCSRISQGRQSAPPQSTSVSSPFLRLSPQLVFLGAVEPRSCVVNALLPPHDAGHSPAASNAQRQRPLMGSYSTTRSRRLAGSCACAAAALRRWRRTGRR